MFKLELTKNELAIIKELVNNANYPGKMLEMAIELKKKVNEAKEDEKPD